MFERAPHHPPALFDFRGPRRVGTRIDLTFDHTETSLSFNLLQSDFSTIVQLDEIGSKRELQSFRPAPALPRPAAAIPRLGLRGAHS